MRKLPGVQPGTIKHVILQTIKELDGANVKEMFPTVRAKCQSARENKIVMDHLYPMVNSDILFKNEEGKYCLTADGYWELAALNDLLEKKKALPVVPPNRTSKLTGTYSGAELGRTSFRRGAYDAYDKPSIINGEKK